MPNLFLIGYRGSGKSTVSEVLATRLGWKAVDADAALEARAGRSIREIFRSDGEEVFRDLEETILQELLGGTRQVVATGGGVILRQANRHRLHQAAHTQAALVVWLRAEPETLLARIATDSTTADRRPNLTAQGGPGEVQQLLKRREPLYRQCAELVVETDGKSPEVIAGEIFACLPPQLLGGSPPEAAGT